MNNRFSLRFVNNITGIEKEPAAASLLNYKISENAIYLSTVGNLLIKDVFVYDLQGRLVSQQLRINNDAVNISLPKGLYLVKVVTDSGIQTIKAIIK